MTETYPSLNIRSDWPVVVPSAISGNRSFISLHFCRAAIILVPDKRMRPSAKRSTAASSAVTTNCIFCCYKLGEY